MKKHTGKVHHSGMHHTLDGHGKKDAHASSAYHEANAKHGMGHGLTHKGEYGGEVKQEGGAGMGSNCKYS